MHRCLALCLLCLCFNLGVSSAKPRRIRKGHTMLNIPQPAPKVCACANASSPLDVQAAQMAVTMAERRSPLLSFHILWDELDGSVLQQQPNAQQAHVEPGATLQSCPVAGEQVATITPLPQQTEMTSCLNEKHIRQGITWAGAMQDDISTLRVVGTWWTKYPSNLTMTLVTTSTSDRLAQLEAQCRTWPGPLSVALFQGLVQEDATGPLTPENAALLRQAVVQISMLVADMATTPGYCQLDVMLTYEVYTEDAAKLLFPINMLRNYARLQARTPLVALVDVDLVVSKSVGNRMYKPKFAQSLLEQVQDKTAFIIPAFDVVGEFEVPAWADALVASSKETMVHAYDRDWVMPFHSGRFPVGHRLTNFARWRVAKADYAVKYESMCEPWLIGDRVLMPMHDARFRGFGLNKIQHIANLNADEFHFKVLHDVFAIHRPHKHAAAKSIYYQRSVTMAGLPSLRTHNYALFQDQQSLMATGSYQPVISPAVQYCMTVLPWWTQPMQQAVTQQAQAQADVGLGLGDQATSQIDAPQSMTHAAEAQAAATATAEVLTSTLH